MKKRSKYWMGSLVLIIMGIFMSGHSKKEGPAYSLYIFKNGVCQSLGYIIIYSPYFTTGGLGQQMTMTTSNLGQFYKVFAKANCSASSAVHFTP